MGTLPKWNEQRLELRVDELVLELPIAAETVSREFLNEAFTLLAKRLEHSALMAPGRGAQELRMDQLNVSELPLAALTGGRGAEDLADALYAQLIRGIE